MTTHLVFFFFGGAGLIVGATENAQFAGVLLYEPEVAQIPYESNAANLEYEPEVTALKATS